MNRLTIIASVLIISSISMGTFIFNKVNEDETTLSKSQSKKQTVNSRMAFINPETGKLISIDKNSDSLSLSPAESIEETIEIIQTFHKDGSISADVSHIQNNLQATIDCNGKLNISHTDKEISTSAQQPCQEVNHVKK